MSLRSLVLVIVAHLVIQSGATLTYQGNSECPCSNPDWCKPVQVQYKKEIFVFSAKDENWRLYDWSKITTVVLFGPGHDPQLTCYAHSKEVKATAAVFFPVANLTNPSARSSWVAAQVQDVLERHLDGVNVDFEDTFPRDREDIRQGLTDLVAELTVALRKNNPQAQVSFDTIWKLSSSYRPYDYKALADIVDFFFVMSYDESESCKAYANAPIIDTREGLNSFLKLGISANQLVLGVPWYGYDYPCSTYDKSKNICTVDNCGGVQRCFSDISKHFSSVDVLWDHNALSPYFSYLDEGTGETHQVWFDNGTSLQIKSDMAVKMNLRGVGMWRANCLDYTNSKQVAEMWGALPSYEKERGSNLSAARLYLDRVIRRGPHYQWPARPYHHRMASPQLKRPYKQQTNDNLRFKPLKKLFPQL